MVVHRKFEGGTVNEKKLLVNGCALERVPKFKYLSASGSTKILISQQKYEQGQEESENFPRYEKLYDWETSDLQLRLRLINCYVWSMLLYSMDSCVLTLMLERR